MTLDMTGDRSTCWHQPVMCREVTDVLGVVPDGVMLDATVGGGGHAAALLQRHPGICLIGIDRDPAALDAAARRLAGYKHQVTLRHTRFDKLNTVLDELGHRRISGALFDLGASSAHFDQAERGFSYSKEGPLDMRMDPTSGMAAADFINQANEYRLAEVLRRNGDIKHARRIAKAIIAKRPFHTTTELAAVVSAATPGAQRRRGHPARRIFQALRIEINSELEILDEAVTAAVERLMPGGRCAVLSYHSGEDRIVKRALRRAAGETPPPRPGLPPVPGTRVIARLLWRGAHKPTEAEILRNRRASSARFRAVERLGKKS